MRPPRRRRRDDRGQVDTIVIFPFFIFLLWVILQVVLWYMAYQAATAGANAGAQAYAEHVNTWQSVAIAATNNELGHAAVTASLASQGSTTPGAIVVKVTGTPAQLLPFSIRVTATAIAPPPPPPPKSQSQSGVKP